MENCTAIGTLGVFIGIVFTIIIIIIILVSLYYYKRNSFIIGYNDALKEYCQSLPDPSYRESVYIPSQIDIYEKNLATALLDISLATSQSYCRNIDPLPLPPGFTKDFPLYGRDPSGGKLTMFAHIFYNPDTHIACFSFTGTMNLPEWRDDFSFKLVEANVLNNYKKGVKCHKGFYGIYKSIRSLLWNWFELEKNNIEYLFITGHSLGGSLSTIAMYDFANTMPNIIHYSFAAPRSGNIEYSKIFDNNNPQSLRICNTEDIVPTLPPPVIGQNVYEQTLNLVSFTKNLGSLVKNHVDSYIYFMPDCFDNRAPC
jgi:hypothetical protein